jgi:hypothetical protein
LSFLISLSSFFINTPLVRSFLPILLCYLITTLLTFTTFPSKLITPYTLHCSLALPLLPFSHYYPY